MHDRIWWCRGGGGHAARARGRAARRTTRRRRTRARSGKSHGKGKTLTVCKKGCGYKSIQKAINAATGKDTIRVKKGKYREGVQIIGSRYDGLKLIGDPKHRDRVVLDGKGVKGGDAQNAVLINNADDVTVRGFHAEQLQGQLLLRHQPPGLRARPAGGASAAACTASTPSTPRAAR